MFSGWKTYPITLLDKANNEIKGYNGFSVTGSCGPIDYSKSKIVEKRRVTIGPISKYYVGLPIGLEE